MGYKSVEERVDKLEQHNADKERESLKASWFVWGIVTGLAIAVIMMWSVI